MCSLLYEYQFLIPQKEFSKVSHIYEVSYENRDEIKSGAGWEGKLGALKSFFGKSLTKISDKMDKFQSKGNAKQLTSEKKLIAKMD